MKPIVETVETAVATLPSLRTCREMDACDPPPIGPGVPDQPTPEEIEFLERQRFLELTGGSSMPMGMLVCGGIVKEVVKRLLKPEDAHAPDKVYPSEDREMRGYDKNRTHETSNVG